MTDVTTWTAARTASSIASGEVSAIEVTQAHLDRIGAVDGKLHAFLHVDTDGALAECCPRRRPARLLATRSARSPAYRWP